VQLLHNHDTVKVNLSLLANYNCLEHLLPLIRPKG